MKGVKIMKRFKVSDTITFAREYVVEAENEEMAEANIDNLISCGLAREILYEQVDNTPWQAEEIS